MSTEQTTEHAQGVAPAFDETGATTEGWGPSWWWSLRLGRPVTAAEAATRNGEANRG